MWITIPSTKTLASLCLSRGVVPIWFHTTKKAHVIDIQWEHKTYGFHISAQRIQGKLCLPWPNTTMLIPKTISPMSPPVYLFMWTPHKTLTTNEKLKMEMTCASWSFYSFIHWSLGKWQPELQKRLRLSACSAPSETKLWDAVLRKQAEKLSLLRGEGGSSSKLVCTVPVFRLYIDLDI